MGFIYKITNIKTNKCYIGETKEANPETRWKQHLRTIAKGRGCPALQDAIQKHGVENFKFEVLIICFDEARFELEKQYIKKYNSMVPNGYNILEGGLGGGGFKGKKHTEEAIEKIRQTSKGRKLSEESKKLLSESLKKAGMSKRVKESEKYKKALEEGRVGHCVGSVLKDDIKTKISEGLKEYFKLNNGKPNSSIQKHRNSMAKAVGKSVAQYDLDNKLIKTFKSMCEASRATGINRNGIRFVIIGRNKTAGGFIWKLNS
jgi:group I intron endonuclease